MSRNIVTQKKSAAANKPAANTVSKKAAVIADNRPAQLKENKTGLPDNLKTGIENLGGMSMDHVKVHYNSSMPAQMQAHAYAQGSDIHVAPGQEKHLPHEAWHIVQQAKGRVKPTLHMGGVPVNNNKGLEKEADNMGAKAIQTVQRYGPDPEEELFNVMQRKQIAGASAGTVMQKNGSDDERDGDEAVERKLSKREKKAARSGKKAQTTHGDTHLSRARIERAEEEAAELREQAKSLPKKEAKKLKKKAENIMAAATKDQLHRGGSGSSKM